MRHWYEEYLDAKQHGHQFDEQTMACALCGMTTRDYHAHEKGWRAPLCEAYEFEVLMHKQRREADG